MKYVIGINKAGHFIPVVSSDEAIHEFLWMALRASGCTGLRSAGFCHVGDNAGQVRVEDRLSESLSGIGPADGDAELLGAFLTDGVAGLELANLVMFRQIQAGKLRP